ncbi:MAG: class I SAM-dependent methyltransferase [Candidatus Binataceae bacterium]
MSGQSLDPERVRREQREFWNSAAPGWKQMFVTLDRAAQHVSDRLVALAGIKAGDRVLDIATGSGEPGITAARKVGPTGRVVATDVSPAMLALARERAAALGISNITFKETGAETLAVEESGFNAAVCRWGLMFVPDLEAAARRIAQLLIAGGNFATAVWGPPEKVPMISVGEEVIRTLAKTPAPPPGAPHPLRLADTTPLEKAMAAAGFKDIRREPIIVRFEWSSAEAFTEQRRAMSAQFRALLSNQPAEMQDRILAAVTEEARRFAGPSGVVHMENEAICIAAHL